MVLKDGAWVTGIGPFDTGDRVTFHVSATDNTGRRVITPDQRFLVQALATD
ncbi:hypothetical protein [Roseibium sp. Sym1]|uniref:hypothetical protein n=1 Tax=Roseibium sp. Sym1 TaxID=3016006 RepID=UPI0022B46537|nr:hypothetical protein [Roseibium sp. Sym1]